MGVKCDSLQGRSLVLVNVIALKWGNRFRILMGTVHKVLFETVHGYTYRLFQFLIGTVHGTYTEEEYGFQFLIGTIHGFIWELFKFFSRECSVNSFKRME